MQAVLPIFRQAADTFWATAKGGEVLEGLLARTVALYPRVSVVSDWQPALDMAKRAGADIFAATEEGAACALLPGLNAALRLFPAHERGAGHVYLNFRNLDSPELALQAIAGQKHGTWTCLASGSQPHDHPCQAFSMEQINDIDVLHMISEGEAFRPAGLPQGVVLSRHFSVDWSSLGVHDSETGPFFRLVQHQTRGLVAEALADPQDISIQNDTILVREEHALARLVLRSECEACLPPSASPYQGPSELVGLCLNPTGAGFSPLLYRDLAHNRMFLRFQAPPRSTNLNVILFGPSGCLASSVYSCAPGQNTIAINAFHPASMYTHMIVGLCGWTGVAASPEIVRPFPGGELWSITGSGELRCSESGELMHGRQAFPPLIELDGSYLAFRGELRPASVAEMKTEGIAVEQLAQDAAFRVRSTLDFLRYAIRKGQPLEGEDALRGLAAKPLPQRAVGLEPCPSAEEGSVERRLHEKSLRLFKLSILSGYMGSVPADFAKEKEEFRRATKRMLIENRVHVLDQEGYEARTSNLSLGLSLLESDTPRRALEPLWSALRAAPDEVPIRQALELTAHKAEDPGVLRRLSRTRIDYLGNVCLPADLAPRDIAMAGQDRIILSAVKAPRLHVLDLVSGSVGEMQTPILPGLHSFCVHNSQRAIILCDHVAHRLAIVSLQDGGVAFVDLHKLLKREAESFS
ncbi:MAG: hypothetical protein Q8S17_07335, partial [Humidesulfovibrio sp.]|nr:hypothetical protein [Humidesulfovibrio sp.]